MERFANNAATTLNGGVTSGATSLTVTDASAFPTAGNFRIKINTEILLVTAVSGTTFTVTRGQEGTTAAAHSNSDSVYHIVTAGGVEQWRADFVGSDTYANRPSAESAGRLYLPTDRPYLHRDDGANWAFHGPLHALTPSVEADFSWVNQGTASYDDSKGVTALTGVKDASWNWRGRFKTAPAPPYSVKMGFCAIHSEDQHQAFGLAFRESSSGKIEIINWNYNVDLTLKVGEFTDASTFSSNPYDAGKTAWINAAPLYWLKIEDDNTNRKFYIGFDGVTFTEVYSKSRTVFSTPDQIGYALSAENTPTAAPVMTVFSWEES